MTENKESETILYWDYIYVMKLGTVILDGDMDEVLRNKLFRQESKRAEDVNSSEDERRRTGTSHESTGGRRFRFVQGFGVRRGSTRSQASMGGIEYTVEERIRRVRRICSVSSERRCFSRRS